MTGPDRPGARARPGAGSGDDAAERSPVRPYAVTRGRTARSAMPPETVVAAATDAARPRGHPPEADRILALCRPWCSVAEISAHVHLPLGVVRVLVEDLVDDGLVRLHSSSPSGGDTDQLERALRELRKRI